MDLKKAKYEFSKYVKNYDMQNKRIENKYFHSFRVMEEAEKIAKSLNLSEEDIELAKLIGLLHDIGRFEQAKVYNNFRDDKTIDHGDLGVKILQKENYIRNFIKEEKYDKIIYKAIQNHNKYKIEQGLKDKELLHAKIIRDADKLDIFYEGSEIFWTTKEEIEKINKSDITINVWEMFSQRKIVDRTITLTPADGIINFISFIYDINFNYTYNEIKKQNYINRILDRFNFENEITAKRMEEVRKV